MKTEKSYLEGVFFCLFLKSLVCIQLRINSRSIHAIPLDMDQSIIPSFANFSTITETSISANFFDNYKTKTYFLSSSDLSQLIIDKSSELYYIGEGITHLSIKD